MRPQFEYCSALWDSYEEGVVFSLEKMQRRAARFDTGDYERETSVKHVNMISTNGWHSLEERRAIIHQTLMHKIVHGLVDVCTATLCHSGRQTRRTSHSVIWGNLMKTVIDLPFPLSQSLNGTPYRSFYAVVPQFS